MFCCENALQNPPFRRPYYSLQCFKLLCINTHYFFVLPPLLYRRALGNGAGGCGPMPRPSGSGLPVSEAGLVSGPTTDAGGGALNVGAFVASFAIAEALFAMA
jgi:hypothetical protein